MYFKALTSLKQHAVIVLSLSGVKHKRMHAALPALSAQRQLGCMGRQQQQCLHWQVTRASREAWRSLPNPSCLMTRSYKTCMLRPKQVDEISGASYFLFLLLSVPRKCFVHLSNSSKIIFQLATTCPLTNEKTITTFSFFRKNKRWTTFNL